MSDAAKTVSSATSLDLLAEQTRDIDNMRRCLLSFNKHDPNAARKAIQNVTLLRVYHQLERIVRYTDLIDKLEDRIYQSIDAKLMESDPDDPDIYTTLIPIQERLQKMMIESHKLLEPYLSMEQLSALEVPKQDDSIDNPKTLLLEQESREKVRTGVQQLMSIINTFDSTAQEGDDIDKESVQSKAQEALAKLAESDKIKDQPQQMNNEIKETINELQESADSPDKINEFNAKQITKLKEKLQE